MSLPAECQTLCPTIPPFPSDGSVEHRFVVANGLRFHTVQAGAGPLVLLLHGFPEFWYSWRHQLPVLSLQFRVVAVDLPGYNLTERPRHGYLLPRLVGDVAALIGALGYERAHVVGHDWGGVIAWTLGMYAPARVERLAILNAPHPGVYMRELHRNPAQRLRSWYVLLFQVPGLAEWLLGRDRCRALVTMLRRSAVVQEAFTDQDLEAYRRVFERPGALTAALSYYRALGRVGLRNMSRAVRVIQAPTHVVWGLRDVALVPELTEGLEAWVPRLSVVRVPDSGHWIQQERPDLVNAELTRFFGDAEQT
jgi:epoxide hydrolase 4